jgi:UDP-glucuronate 4-epimerase
MTKPVILVTGAAGFIGSHSAEALIRRGWRVVGVDNFNDFYNPALKRANVRAVGSALEIEEADITDAPRMHKLIGSLKPQVILHLAAMAGVRPSIEQPAHYVKVNLDGTTHLLQAAVENKVSKFVFASSSSVYGNNPKVPFSEEDSVENPISPYAATKRAGELICHTYWHLYKLPIFCLRFFTVFGPRQRPDLAINKFTRLISQGKPIPFFGDGSTSRDYTFVADIVDGILASIEKCDRYRVYNLGGSHPVSLTEMVQAIEQAIGKPAIIDRKPAQPGDVERTFADVSRAKQELGYAPKVSFLEGIRRFVAWYRENGALYEAT